MSVEKVSLSFQRELVERAREAAQASGQSLSAFVAGAVEHRIKMEEGRRVLEDWETEHGSIAAHELGRVTSKWRA